MSVTAMYVELIVVGLGSLTWAVLFISGCYSDEWMSKLSSQNFKDYAYNEKLYNDRIKNFCSALNNIQ